MSGVGKGERGTSGAQPQDVQAAGQDANRRGCELEDRLAAPMFALAVLFLMFLAAALQLTRASDEASWGGTTLRIVFAGLLLLWPIFVAEGVLRLWITPRERRTWKSLAAALAVGLAPPLRMGAYSRSRPQHLWLPGMGWRETDFDLQKTLERFFGGPMFFMALLILPILAVEYFWSDAVEAYPLLQIALRIAVSVIWLAFAIEFIIRFSAADEKLNYAFTHWVDLIVVVLPMLEFLPFLRLLRVTRLMRLQNVARMAKYYRLYGMAEKGWRGAVVLQVIQHWFSRSPQARLSRLQSHLEDTQHRMRALEQEADYYRRRIAALENGVGAQGAAPENSERAAHRPNSE